MVAIECFHQINNNNNLKKQKKLPPILYNIISTIIYVHYNQGLVIVVSQFKETKTEELVKQKTSIEKSCHGLPSLVMYIDP